MCPIDDSNLRTSFVRSNRVRRVETIPAHAIEPIRASFQAAYDQAKGGEQAPQDKPSEGPLDEVDLTPLEADPPETYDEHGERHHAKEGPVVPHLDLEV